MRLLIKEKLLKEVIDSAIKSQIEICGFLLGEVKGDVYFVKKIYFSENVANSPLTFRMNPQDICKADMLAEREKLAIVGIFHSHPFSPRPSKLDLGYMEYWPIPWLIIDKLSGSFKAYILKNDTLQELGVIIG